MNIASHPFRPLLALVMLLAVCVPQSAWAWGGSGTSSSPYTISTAADMQKFANIVGGTGGESRNVAACAKLTADIALTGTWTAMGTSSTPFTGTFDGQGHAITGLNLTGSANQGLFGCINGATIKNFTLAGTVTASGDNVGSVVGYAKGASSILDVASSASITMTAAKSHLGGIAGNIEGSTAVKGCTYSGTMNVGSSTDSNGGIVGFANASCSGTIQYSFCQGTITTTGSGPVMGGILGYTNDESKNFGGVKNCYSCATLTYSGSDKYVNAIVGRIRATASTTENNTYLEGTAARPCNTDGPTIPATNRSITINAEADHGTVSQTYINPTSTTVTQVCFEAFPDNGYHFKCWTGPDYNSVITFELTKNVSATAWFDKNSYTITALSNNEAYGAAFVADVDGSFAHQTTRLFNENVWLYAMAYPEAHFTHWNDDNPNATRSVGVKGDKTYTAYFEPHTYGDWIVDKRATCGESGLRHRECTYPGCNGVQEEYTHVDHNFVLLKDAQGNPVWDWDDDFYTARLKLVCTNDASHTKYVWTDTNGQITNAITTPATCGHEGVRTYTATVEYEGVTYTSTRTVSIPALTHDYQVVRDAKGNPVWEWDGFTQATLLVACKHDATDTRNIVVTGDAITNAITTAATCENEGVRTYSARATHNGVTYTGTKTEPLPAIGHDYHVATDGHGNGVFYWSDDFSVAFLKMECSHNRDHESSLEATGDAITVIRNLPTCDTSGEIIYKATLTYEGVTYSREAREFPPALAPGEGHHMDEYGRCTVCGLQGRAVYLDGTLTFYYDNKYHEGKTYTLNTGNADPDWRTHRSYIKNVVFDKRFADARPVSCKSWFSECTQLEDITGIEYLNTEAVTDMQYMFYNCSNLKLSELRFDTRKVKNMYYMFGNCYALETLYLNFYTPEVENMAYMFYGCKNLQTLRFLQANTSKVKNFSCMFQYCYHLATLELSDSFTMESMEKGGKALMFFQCGSSVDGGGLVKNVNKASVRRQLSTDTDFVTMHFPGNRVLTINDVYTLRENILIDYWTDLQEWNYDSNADGVPTILDLVRLIDKLKGAATTE